MVTIKGKVISQTALNYSLTIRILHSSSKKGLDDVSRIYNL